MDKYQNADREASTRRALTSASRYLEKYRNRSVSLILNNATTISHIIGLDVWQEQVCAIVGERGLDNQFKTVMVSIHDITAVSEDQADLVTEGSMVVRAKALFEEVMAAFKQSDNHFSDAVRDEYMSDFGDTKPPEVTVEMMAAMEKNITKALRVAVAECIRAAYRPLVEYSEWRGRVLLATGFERLIEDREATPDFFEAISRTVRY